MRCKMLCRDVADGVVSSEEADEANDADEAVVRRLDASTDMILVVMDAC